LQPLGEAEHDDRANDAGLGRLHRIELVMDRRRRASQVVDLVDLDKQRMGHVVAHRLEMRVAQQMGDVVFAAGEVIVDAQYVVAASEQPLAQMRAEKSGATGDQYPLWNRMHGSVLRVSLALPSQPIARSAAGIRVSGVLPADLI